MSVPEGERSQNRLEVLVKARDLAAYTVHICSNTNVFLPQYRSAITSDIEHVAISIFIDSWTANNVYVRDDPEKLAYRQRLQSKAISSCNNLLALIQIAQSVFHLKHKRIEHWGRMILDVRILLKTWKEAEAKRYEKLTHVGQGV